MGRDLLRRKTLALVAAVCAVLATDCQGTASSVSPGPEALPAEAMLPPPVLSLRDSSLPSESDVDLDLPPIAALSTSAPAPLPPLQGLRGLELYSLDMPDEAVVDAYEAGLLATQRDWLQAALQNSIPYRLFIARAVAESGLPRELQFLPAVESGFQPRAVSPQGATGLWQLMRNTASPYGLRMDQWVDERKDFLKATGASLQKLRENYDQFGDWYLALAAYNCGSGRLSSILRRYPRSDYWTLRRKGALPRETAAFVPQFLAISKILSYPGRYGLEVGWDPAPAWERIELDRSVDLRLLSQASGVPLDLLVSSNAELNYPLTPPGSYHYQLKVPRPYRQAIEQALADANMPLLDFVIHVVKEGDTLLGMAKTYHVSVDLIMEFNPTLKPRALRLGSKILVPVTPARSHG